MRADPAALVEVASRIIDNTEGEADLYYTRDTERDYLSYVAPEDMGALPDGTPRRAYGYTTIGFFADEALAEKRSTHVNDHERVAIAPGDSLYSADDMGGVYRIDVLEKPSLQRISLAITRLK